MRLCTFLEVGNSKEVFDAKKSFFWIAVTEAMEPGPSTAYVCEIKNEPA